MAIRITAKQMDEIKSHLESCYPEEGCCLLLGIVENGTKILKEVFLVKNTAPDSRKRRYFIDPLEYSKIEKQAENKKFVVIGIAHSHPEHPARPSNFDLDHSWPFFSYLIISVKSGKSKTIKSWELKEDRSVFEEEGIV